MLHRFRVFREIGFLYQADDLVHSFRIGHDINLFLAQEFLDYIRPDGGETLEFLVLVLDCVSLQNYYILGKILTRIHASSAVGAQIFIN